MGVCQCIGLEIALHKSRSKYNQAEPIAIHNFQKQKSSNLEIFPKTKSSKQSRENCSLKDLSSVDTCLKTEEMLTIHIVGNEKTGKTSLVIRLLKNKFDPFYIPSINIETTKFHYSSSTLREKRDIQFLAYNFSLFDMKKIKNDDFIFVFFDESNNDSIDKAMSFISNNNIVNIFNKEKIFLIGNKLDLKTRNFPESKLEKFCKEQGICFYEISVKTNVGIKQLLHRVCGIVSDNSEIKNLCLTPPLFPSHKYLKM